jgi:hypothetical protein
MEFPANVQNIAGLSPAEFKAQHPNPNDEGRVGANGQVGNLQLTPQEETDLVNFLKTLTDGYTRPNPVQADLTFILKDLPSPPASGAFVEQLKASQFVRYFSQNTSGQTNQSATSSNILTGTIVGVTNLLMSLPGYNPR